MIRLLALLLLVGVVPCAAQQPARRVVIFKIDGLNADLLYRNMREKDPTPESRGCHGSLISLATTALSSRTSTRAA